MVISKSVQSSRDKLLGTAGQVSGITVSIRGIPIDHPALLGMLRDLGMGQPVLSQAKEPTTPAPAGDVVDAAGFPVLDARGVAALADKRNATEPYLKGLRVLGRPGATEADLRTANPNVGGFIGSTKKRLRKAGSTAPDLFRIDAHGNLQIAEQTRDAIARHFGDAP